MNAKHLGMAIARKIKSDGVTGLLLAVLKNLRPRRANSFDREFGTDTEIEVPAWRLNLPPSGVRYQTIKPETMRLCIDAIKIDGADFVFIDLGSGKGRSLLVASEYGFKQVVGVEFSEALHRVAVENIRLRNSPRVSAVLLDASLYEFPAHPLVVYLYNPFGEEIFRRVLANLERSVRHNDRKVYVLYFNPVCASLLDQSPDFVLLRQLKSSEGICAIYEHRH